MMSRHGGHEKKSKLTDYGIKVLDGGHIIKRERGGTYKLRRVGKDA